MKVGYDITECYETLIDYIVDYVDKYNSIPYFNEIALDFKDNEAFLTYLHDNAAFVKFYIDSY